MLFMDVFWLLPDYFILRAEQLCADLIYDLETNVVLSALKDGMSNTAPGYLFVSQPGNGLANGHA
jgi:hypothetical protein